MLEHNEAIIQFGSAEPPCPRGAWPLLWAEVL